MNATTTTDMLKHLWATNQITEELTEIVKRIDGNQFSKLTAEDNAIITDLYNNRKGY